MIGTIGRTGGAEFDETRRYLADSAVEIRPRERLQIAGILRPDVEADLEPDASVAVLLPHDATLVKQYRHHRQHFARRDLLRRAIWLDPPR